MRYEELVYTYRWPITIFLFGVILVSVGLFSFLVQDSSENKLIILEDTQESAVSDRESESTIIVEISGAVSQPGVYTVPSGSRVEDAITLAGGFSAENSEWVSKFLNRAAHLVDGQKIYIPSVDEPANSAGKQSEGENANNLGGSNSILGSTESRININTASKSELESMWGIGPVYAQNIIDHRPYSDISELISKGIVKQNVYDRNKDLISVY